MPIRELKFRCYLDLKSVNYKLPESAKKLKIAMTTRVRNDGVLCWERQLLHKVKARRPVRFFHILYLKA